MSGILGLIYQDGRPVYDAQLRTMSAAIAHRGPDDRGIWVEDSAGLGHQMLWTTPESLLEKLPRIDPFTQLVITADIRLDNRSELITQLNLGSESSEKLTDSQILLTAYRQWGEACPEYLLGDFAFAIWNPNTQTLFCARDHFGVKPFYFYTHPETFAFASEIKALLALEDIPAKLNEVRFADYATLTLNDPSITSYQNIWRLPPAHALTLHPHQAPQQRQYWQLDPNKEIHHASNEDYAQAYRHHFLEAVRCRMRSAFPVGAHLSGGLDSSSVACTARYLSLQDNGAPIHTFSHTYPDVPDSDESTFIDIVLKQNHFIHHNIRGDTLGALTEWEALLGILDEALIGSSYFNWIINRAAGENGIRILMSGFDGDSVVGHGLNYLTESAQALQWQTVIQEATQFIERYGRVESTASGLIKLHSLPMLGKLAQSRRWLSFAQAVNQLSSAVQISRKRLWYEYGFKELDGVRQVREWRSKQRAQYNRANPFPFANPAFLERLNYAQRQQTLQPTLPPPQSEREYQWRTLTSGLMALSLEVVDLLSTAHKVETRHPFLDKRLVEYCLAIPSCQKLNQGWSRVVMRRGMAGILPSEIQWRGSKGNSTAVFFHGLQTYDRQLLDEVVNKDFNRLADYIDLPYARKYYSAVMDGKCKEIAALWFVITLALWFRYHRLKNLETGILQCNSQPSASNDF
jgi:asparagine synthase (glutamine-hydrolysing)